MYILNENKSLKELSEILGFKNVQTDAKIQRIIFNSKIAKEGDLFIPLKGNNHVILEGDEGWPIFKEELKNFLKQ